MHDDGNTSQGGSLQMRMMQTIPNGNSSVQARERVGKRGSDAGQRGDDDPDAVYKILNDPVSFLVQVEKEEKVMNPQRFSYSAGALLVISLAFSIPPRIAAQPERRQPERRQPTPNDTLKSPEVLPDRKVTFRI